MNIIKNVEMNEAQKAKAFEVLGGYINGKQVKEITVDLHDEINGQVVLTTELHNRQTLQTIIRSRWQVIAHHFN